MKTEMTTVEYRALIAAMDADAKPRTPRKMSATEGNEQASLFDFLRTIEGRISAVRWAFHPPNGGARPRRQNSKGQTYSLEGQQLARQGVKPGVPDVLLPVRRSPFVGFAGELKAGRNKTSTDQDLWLAHLESDGWKTGVYWHWEDCARAMLYYLGEVPERYGL